MRACFRQSSQRCDEFLVETSKAESASSQVAAGLVAHLLELANALLETLDFAPAVERPFLLAPETKGQTSFKLASEALDLQVALYDAVPALAKLGPLALSLQNVLALVLEPVHLAPDFLDIPAQDLRAHPRLFLVEVLLFKRRADGRHDLCLVIPQSSSLGLQTGHDGRVMVRV